MSTQSEDVWAGYTPVEIVEAGERWPVPHPIPYQGSKRNLASVILSYFPSKVNRLREPFAGSAAISLAAAYRDVASEFHINDGHEPLAELWSAILTDAKKLADDYETLWHSQKGQEREYYDTVRKLFNDTHRPDYFLYLLARCVKAAIRYNSDGQFNNSPDNRRKGAHPDRMRSRILGASSLLSGRTSVSSKDYRDVLSGCRAGDLFYFDPPYQGVCGRRDTRYAPKFDHHTFCGDLADLNKRDALYVVSYDGRLGDKQYGEPMPKHLNLVHIEINAGRSTTATLLGRTHQTFESLYLSPALAGIIIGGCVKRPRQGLFEGMD